MTISDPVYNTISRPVNGLVCCIGDSSIAVCNPATRQSVKLPDITPNGRYIHARLGYDPVEDQYKVLCVIVVFNHYQEVFQTEHLVCTVRTSEKQEWRKIENTTVGHYGAFSGGICIDGAIYYEVGQSMIVRFDVRSENMELIEAPEESDFCMKILEDAEKQEWSRMICALPSELKGLLGSHETSKGDIHNGDLMVFHPCSWSLKPFFVWYYDLKKESITRKVELMVDGDFRRIHGISEKSCQMLCCYPGYFEKIRFL